MHVSNARAVVEPRVAYARVRFFRDDLEAAVRGHSRDPRFTLVVTQHADSLVSAYAAAHLGMRARGRALTLAMVGSGEEKGIQPELDIWWIDFRFDAAVPIGRELEVRNELLFDRYRDQTNIMKFRLPDGAEKTVIFVPGEGTYVLKF